MTAHMALFRKKTEDQKKPATAAKATDVKAEKGKTEPKSMKELYSTPSTATAKDAKGKNAKATKTVYGNAYKIIMKPLVTEKVSNLGALNKYAFAVALKANKIEIAKAVKEIYGIKPTGVNVINKIGKKARYGRSSGKRKDWKKAIVTLPEGQTIKLYEGV